MSESRHINAVRRRIWIILYVSIHFATHASAQLPAPANLPVLPDTYGTIAIGDVRGLLERAGQMVSRVSPGFDEQMLRQQLGALAGDPQLEGLPTGAGLVIVIPRSGLPFGFLEVEGKKIAAYEALVKQRGLPAVARYQGLLLGAPNAASLDASKRFARKVKMQILRGRGEPNVSSSFKLGDLLRQYEPQAKIMLQKMESRRPQEKTRATGQRQSWRRLMNIAYGLAKKIGLLQIGLSPSREGLDMNFAVSPKSGMTDLVKNRITENDAGPAMLELLPATNGIRAELTCSPHWIAGPYTNLMADIMKESGLSDGQIDELRSWMQTSTQALSGVVGMDFGGHSATRLSGAYALSVTSEQRALQFLRQIPARSVSTGIAGLSGHIGMPLTISFKENARQYGDLPIHQLEVQTNFGGASPETDKLTNIGEPTCEVAIANKVLLYAVAPVKIETLIDAARLGKHPESKPLASRERFPGNLTFYSDINVSAISSLSGSGATHQQAEMKRRAALAFRNAPPMQLGGFSDSEQYRMTMFVPAETLKALTHMWGVPEVSSRHNEESTGTARPQEGLHSRSKL